MTTEILQQYITNQYARAIVVLFIIFVVLRTFIFLIEKIVTTFTKKTKTNLDDILIQRLSKPVTILVFSIGMFFAVSELTLEKGIFNIISNVFHSIDIVLVAIISYVVLDVVIIKFFKKVIGKTQTNIDDSLVSLIHSVLRILWVVLALLYILDLWGVQIGPLLAGLGIAGLAVALALQPVLSNIFSGVSIIMDKTVRVGDLVYLDSNTKGKILKVGLRSTRIQTFDNELIIIPNSKLADSLIQNVALPEPKSRVVIPFGVAYGSSIEKVKTVVLKEIKSVKNILLNDPEPSVRFLEMADSSLNFKAYFYVDTYENRFAAIDEANTKIYNALNKAGISIPFPQMDVHLKK